MKASILFVCLFALLSSARFSEAIEPLLEMPVDLHAHLFMPEATGLDWFGSFHERPRARNWSDRFRSRVTEGHLHEAPYSIIVLSLYTHPLFLGSADESLERQLKEIQEYVKKNPKWRLSKNCSDARRNLSQGFRVFLLSIEGAAGNLETSESQEKWLIRNGVSIVTPLHFTNDRIGGAALLPGIGALMNPLAWITSWFHERGEEGVFTNPMGLTERGLQFIKTLVSKKIWIDLSHASEASLRDVYPVLDSYGQSALMSHSMLRRFYLGERALSRGQMIELKKRQGIVGVIPSNDVLGTRKTEGQNCGAGLTQLVHQLQSINEGLEGVSISLASDIHAPLTFLSSGCSEQEPFVDYGDMSRLVQVIKQSGVHLLTAGDFLNRCPSGL